MQTWIRIGIVFGIVLLTASRAQAHCQVPCGIYDDPARVAQLAEHVQTIHKAIHAIGHLSSKRDPESKNQLARWIATKEAHAEEIIRTVADYFLLQRIKPAGQGEKRAAYLEQLQRHHAVMLQAMLCKQTVNASHAKELGKAVDAISGYWR